MNIRNNVTTFKIQVCCVYNAISSKGTVRRDTCVLTCDSNHHAKHGILTYHPLRHCC